MENNVTIVLKKKNVNDISDTDREKIPLNSYKP